MKDKTWMIFPIIIICLLVSLFVIETINAFKRQYECGYIDACKDFYQGKLKYDLVEHNDGTKTWEKVNK